MTRWIKCSGCEGEVGVDEDCSDVVVECPKCGTEVPVPPVSTILWRPASSAEQSAESQAVAGSVKMSAPKAAAESPRSESARADDRLVGVRKRAPEWWGPVGWISLVLGIFAFLASAAVGAEGSKGGAFLAGLVNPLFFIGVPFGIYLLSQRSQRRSPLIFFCPYCDNKLVLDQQSKSGITCQNCGKVVLKP